MKEYQSKFSEKVTVLPYKAEYYIQEEDGKFLIYIKSGAKLPKWYKSFDSKKEALKAFQDILGTVVSKHKFEDL